MLFRSLDTGVIYPTHSEARVREAKQTLVRLIKKYGVTLIAIGNGTASKETRSCWIWSRWKFVRL